MIKKTTTFLFLIASDFICLYFCFAVAFLIRGEILPVFYPSFLERPIFFHIYSTHFYMFSIWALVFLFERLYTKRHSFWEEMRLLLTGISISFTIIAVLIFITQQYLLYSRVIIFIAWILSLILFPLFRLFTKTQLIRFNMWKKRVLVIGPINSTSTLIDAIKKNKILGYDVVGCLTADPGKIGQTISGVKVLGHIEEIEEWKEKVNFEDIIVTLPDVPRDQLIPLMKRWENVSETIRLIPRTGDLITTGVEIENIGNVLSLTVRRNLAKPWNILIKAVFEMLLALVSLVIVSPFFLVLALAIKLDSKGPVFFIQERCGKWGKKFKLIKFRSMFVDADLRLESYLKEDQKAQEEWQQFKKLKTFDPRVTRIGKILRRFSLDELPQILNVLNGKMSLIGPRPYILEELKEVESVKSIILQVKPGISGLWQTSGRSNLSFNERLVIDEYYIRNWSFWLDIVILIKTIKTFSKGEGAF